MALFLMIFCVCCSSSRCRCSYSLRRRALLHSRSIDTLVMLSQLLLHTIRFFPRPAALSCPFHSRTQHIWSFLASEFETVTVSNFYRKQMQSQFCSLGRFQIRKKALTCMHACCADAPMKFEIESLSWVNCDYSLPMWVCPTPPDSIRILFIIIFCDIYSNLFVLFSRFYWVLLQRLADSSIRTRYMWVRNYLSAFRDSLNYF